MLLKHCSALIFLTFLSYSCRSISRSELDTTVVDAKTPNAAMGSGFDSLSYQIKGDCVVRTTPEVIGSSAGKSTTFEILKLESANDLLKSTNTSASASFSSALTGAKGKASFINTISVNDYSLFVVARVNVLLNKRRMRDVVLKPDVLDLIKTGSNEAFQERCGDEFIVTETLGGEFYVVIEIETKTEAERQSISASLNGNYGAFNAKGSFSENLNKVMSKSSTKIYGYIAGTSDQQIALDPNTIITKVGSFPDTVTMESVVPYEYETISYKTLPFPTSGSIADLSRQKDTIKQLYELRFELRRFLNNINYIFANQGQFKQNELNVAELNMTANKLRGEINKVDEVVSACFKDFTQCNLPTNLKFPDYKLPIRQQNEIAPPPPKTVKVTSMECPGSRTETVSCGAEKFSETLEHKFYVQSVRNSRNFGKPTGQPALCQSLIGRTKERLPGVNGEVNHTDYTRSWSNPYPSGGYDYTLCEDACQKSGLQFSKEIDYREASFIFSTVGDIAEGFCSKLNRTSLGFDTCTVEVPATCEKLVVE